MALSIAPTSDALLCDQQGRPYFLWDCDVTLSRFLELIADAGSEERYYWIGKVMRQAKPDDALRFVSRADMRRLWPQLERHLGQTRAFWRWLLEV